MPKPRAVAPSRAAEFLAWIRTWRYTDVVLIGIATVAVSAVNYWWARTDARPPDWDSARHLWTSLLYRDTLHQHAILPLLQQYHYYPPLVYWMALPFYKLFGVSAAAAVMSNVVWVATLLAATYALGKRLGGRTTAFVAMILVASYPMFVSQFKTFQLDAPLAAMVMLALCLLLYSEHFRRPGYTIAFGVACGLGMLTKWTFVACLIVPVLYALARAARADLRQRFPRRLAVIGVAGLIAYTICSPWYAANIQQFRIDMKQNGVPQARLEGDPQIGSFAGDSYYFFDAANQQLFVPGLLLFLASLILIVIKSGPRADALELVLAIISMYVLFTIIANKDARYTLPALPAVAVVTAAGLTRLRGWWRGGAAGLGVVYGLIMFASISFGTSLLPTNAAFAVGNQAVTIYAQRGYITGPPQRQNWGLQSAFAYVARQTPSRRSLSYVGPDTIWLNSWDLTYYSKLDGVTLSPNAAYHLVRTFHSGQLLPPEPIAHYSLPDQTQLGLYRS